MRNLLLLLLLANILYFVWGMWANKGGEPGVAIVTESELGPPLAATANRDAEAAASVGAVLGSGEPSDLEALVGRSCVTVGPFRASEDAERASMEYTGEGMRTAQRSGEGQVFIGHSVQVVNVATRAEGREMLSKLHDGGLGDAFLVGNEEIGLAISLGIFGNQSNAEKVELQARSIGFEVTVSPMTRDATVFFVDIALPPGKGAGSIVDKHGEDRVLLREAATCPQPQ
ncbi:MAG: SPOR domain-containing protein [Woeseiaceae bacterium]|nr:SPOR domain-containing protein [Woeseiaceae bacterium]